MKLTEMKFQEPKTKTAALNLASELSRLRDIMSKRRKNLQTNKDAAEVKVIRLQNTLADIANQLSSIDKNDKNLQNKIDLLKAKHAITEAEILECRSAALRKELSLAQEAGITNGEDVLL